MWLRSLLNSLDFRFAPSAARPVQRDVVRALRIEALEDRCTPGAMAGDLGVQFPAHHSGPHAEISARVGSPQGHTVPIKVAFRCIIDINSGTISSTGFSTGGLGHWTSQEHIDSAVIDPVADRGVYSGTGTLVTHKGDKLFFSFTTSWQLSTGEGTHSITTTGGTGKYAGVTGTGTGQCIITADFESQIFTCKSEGSGILVFPN
jgi:hypothetical protein